MALNEILEQKGIKYNNITNAGIHLRQQWESVFVNHLNNQEKKNIYLHDEDGICGFLWHVFSYKKKDCLVGSEAETAFNTVDKGVCYVFYQHSDDAFLLEEASILKAEDLSAEADIYIVDKEFTWAYVKTHEDGCCGPYFALEISGLTSLS